MARTPAPDRHANASPADPASVAGGAVSVPAIVPAVLIAATTASILSTDLYAPSLPHLPAIFATDAATVQLTMSLNALAFGAAQLVHGPLADRVGRRPVLLVGMTAFVLFSLACAAASSIGALMAARILQGLAASSEAVVALAVIRDLYRGAQAVRIMSLYGMAIALAPAVGPVIGGYMHVAFGWRSNFLLLTGVALAVTVMTWRYLPESGTPDAGALAPHRLAAGFGGLFRHRVFMGYVLVLGAVMGGLFAFITAGPFILIDRLGVATQHFGYYQAVIVLVYVLGNVLANRAVGRLGIEALLGAGLVVTAVGGIAVLGVIAVAESAETLVAAMGVFALGLGLVFATAPVRAMETAPGGSGLAAALLGSLEMAGAGLGSVIVASFHDGTAWPLAGCVAGFGLLSGVVYAALRPWRDRPMGGGG